MEEMLVFSKLRSDRLLDTTLSPAAEFHFDVLSIFNSSGKNFIDLKRLSHPYTVLFRHDPDQIKLIEFHKTEYGDSETGYTRILARLPITRLTEEQCEYNTISINPFTLVNLRAIYH